VLPCAALALQEMMAANAALLALKAQRLEAQRREEEAFRAATMAKFAEDDRIEQLNAQRRRLKASARALSWVHACVHALSSSGALGCWQLNHCCCAVSRLQVAEHKRAVDELLADKRARFEAACAAEEAEEAAW
jgi:hypothetical protein